MEQRLKILRDAQLIDPDIYSGMLDVIKRVETYWRLNIHHAQGEIMITHMANALMRSRKGEAVAAIDPELFAEVTASDRYRDVYRIHCDLLRYFDFPVPASEQGYLQANIYGLLLSRSENVA